MFLSSDFWCWRSEWSLHGISAAVKAAMKYAFEKLWWMYFRRIYVFHIARRTTITDSVFLHCRWWGRRWLGSIIVIAAGLAHCQHSNRSQNALLGRMLGDYHPSPLSKSWRSHAPFLGEKVIWAGQAMRFAGFFTSSSPESRTNHARTVPTNTLGSGRWVVLLWSDIGGGGRPSPVATASQRRCLDVLKANKTHLCTAFSRKAGHDIKQQIICKTIWGPL